MRFESVLVSLETIFATVLLPETAGARIPSGNRAVSGRLVIIRMGYIRMAGE